MPTSTLFIKINNKEIRYSPGHSLKIEFSNFPIHHCGFNREAFWETEIVHYDSGLQQVLLKVTNYSCENEDGFQKQNPKTQLKWIDFEKFRWAELDKCLGHHQYIKLIPYLEDRDPLISLPSDWSNPHLPPKVEKTKKGILTPGVHPNAKAPSIQMKEFSISFPVHNIEFLEGKGMFKITRKLCDILDEAMEVEIENPEVREEYQAVNVYIQRIIGKEIIINLNLEKPVLGVWRFHSVNSEDFLRINDELIENAVLEMASREIQKNKSFGNSKTVLTSLELQTELKMTGLNLDEDKLLDQLLKDKPGVHFHELKWLSKAQTIRPGARLKFVTRPDFGFLFFLLPSNKVFFILETYKADRATYIWFFTASEMMENNSEAWIKEKYKEIENEIEKIDARGRHGYREEKPQHFTFADHLNEENGFQKWKITMESLLKD